MNTETCPQCGETNISVYFITERVEMYDEKVLVDVPVHFCASCRERWTNSEAEKLRTVALFEYEKDHGISRTVFADEEEKNWYRKVWDEE